MKVFPLLHWYHRFLYYILYFSIFKLCYTSQKTFLTSFLLKLWFFSFHKSAGLYIAERNEPTVTETLRRNCSRISQTKTRVHSLPSWPHAGPPSLNAALTLLTATVLRDHISAHKRTQTHTRTAGLANPSRDIT